MTAWLRAALFGASLCLLVGQPASAEVRIRSSLGGRIGSYVELFQIVNASGQRVVIDGPCMSACTLVLSTVPANRICVTRRAVLGFHAAWSRDLFGQRVAEPEASAIVLNTYPAPVRQWILRHGGLTSRLLLLRGRALTAMYRSCR